MKKIIAIICILVLIIIGIFVYKKTVNKNKNVTADEVVNIQNYISRVYMWQEVTDEALPKFDNINNAPDKWLWKTVLKEDYELTYDEIEQTATSLFGKDLTKQFPKEGIDGIVYDDEIQKYAILGMDLDSYEDSFLIKNIEKNKNEYKVEIAEYLVDYSGIPDDDSDLESETSPEYDVYIEDLNKNQISTIKSSEIVDGDTKIIEKVKENIDKFPTKTLTLNKDSKNNIHLQSVE